MKRMENKMIRLIKKIKRVYAKLEDNTEIEISIKEDICKLSIVNGDDGAIYKI